MKASYWSIQLIMTWFAQEAIQCFPPPKDRVIYLVGDGSHKNKRGEKNPVVQKGRDSKYKPFYFGIRFVLLMVCWNGYRIPYVFSIILPKKHPDYENENTLFREMIGSFVPPSWAKTVIVLGDAGYSSKDNMHKIKEMDKHDPCRHWFFVFAIARTWKTEKNKAIKNLVQHLPRNRYRRTWVPSVYKEGRRKTFWAYARVLCLRHVGEVTIVLSKKGRNVGPKNTKLLVTNLPRVTSRQVLCIYQRRWAIEMVFKELKSGLGLGEHQVTKEIHRVENSIGTAIIAYLFLLKARRRDIKPGTPWSIFQLQNNLRMAVVKHQIEHSMTLKINKLLKAA